MRPAIRLTVREARSRRLPGDAVGEVEVAMKPHRKETAMTRQRITVPVEGLSCGGGGALAVERALMKMPGVIRVYVNPATEMAYVEYDPEVTDVHRLVATVDRTGFRAGTPVAR
jgi:copper chaperone CopZ